ncbi:MAG: type II secretion system protein [Verrucomicrobiaceae bacterium]|nr:type II secretion system protein [Verrucomicrobiaceae bacterium]
MKIPTRHAPRGGPRHRTDRRGIRGFTLLEMSVAMALTMGLSTMLVGIMQQQVSFTRMLTQFRFLREEAPNINTLMTTMINKADSYRIYTSTGNAKAATNAVRDDGRALRLRLRNPDGTAAHAIIAFESQEGTNRLNYYYRSHSASTWPSHPSWTITSRPALVNFSNSTGILLVTMTGPDGEEITYAGNPD